MMPYEMAVDRSAKSATRNEEATLTIFEAQRLIGICVELLDLCSKVTGQIDPAVGEMIAFARDEALTSVHYSNSSTAFDRLSPSRQ
jgi:hypothetical protein